MVCGPTGSVEIPDLTSLPEILDKLVFDGYRKGGCRSGGGEAPKNVVKNDDFYRAENKKKQVRGSHQLLIKSKRIIRMCHERPDFLKMQL